MSIHTHEDVKAIVGSLQGALNRIEGRVDNLSALISQVEGAANMVEPQPVEMKKAGGDVPRGTLTLARLDDDLEREVNHLEAALRILS
jgi:hypothetical protein